MGYNIQIKNIGKEPELFQVYDNDGYKRPVNFRFLNDANECIRVIQMLRSDSAFEWCKPISNLSIVR